MHALSLAFIRLKKNSQRHVGSFWQQVCRACAARRGRCQQEVAITNGVGTLLQDRSIVGRFTAAAMVEVATECRGCLGQASSKYLMLAGM